jgi:hypothetical protein
LPRDFFFFKLTPPLTVSVKEKGGKPDEKPDGKPHPLPMGQEIRTETSSLRTQDFAQKPK